MLKNIIALTYITTIAACYPKYIEISSPSIIISPNIPSEIASDIKEMMAACSSQYESARKSSYDLHKSEYYAGVVGSGTTMITGSGAGALGAANQKAFSGIAGGLSLASGLVTLILVNPSGIKSAEEQQAKIASAWNRMREAKNVYETAVITKAPEADQRAKLAVFVATINDCGLQPPLRLTTKAAGT